VAATRYRLASDHLHELLGHLRLRVRAAVRRRQLDDPRRFADDGELQRLSAELAAAEADTEARAQASPAELVPLLRLRAAFALGATEVRVLALLVGLELDLRLREQVRLLASDDPRPHPDVGMLAEIIYATPGERARLPEELGPDGALVRFGLVDLEERATTAFVLRRVRAVERVLELAHGKDVLDRQLARFVTLVPPRRRDELVIEDARFDEVSGLVGALIAATRRQARHPVLVLAGPDGAGRKAMLAATAAHHGLATLRVRVRALPRDDARRAIGPMILREAVLARALVVLDGVDDDGGSRGGFALDDLLFGTAAVPLAATCGRITGTPPRFGRGAVVLEVGVPTELARAELWRRALPSATPRALPRWAAERYTITPGVIGAAAIAATARAAARPDDHALVAADLHDGLRGVLDAKLATLGMRITWRQTWDDLVLPPDAVNEVREFIARIAHRRRVYEEWGFGRKVAKGLGLSALFSGPPGTGKTMVAGLIAEELKLDLYQVDLSKVVSKWVGETEKNLAELFDAAEAGHAILLFDEADSLFAKRTSVQSSNDRYANLEVNYLLQRMESFAGVVILTTNHETAIDEAFRRRLSLRVEFPVPEADERARLWRAMLPTQAAITGALDFATLGRHFEMTGGYIKNAALRAAFLAADDGQAIAMRHLLRAARAEYQAMGKVIAAP